MSSAHFKIPGSLPGPSQKLKEEMSEIKPGHGQQAAFKLHLMEKLLGHGQPVKT